MLRLHRVCDTSTSTTINGVTAAALQQFVRGSVSASRSISANGAPVVEEPVRTGQADARRRRR